jgi:hypothetical protein
MTDTFDFVLVWDWEYDSDFTSILESHFRAMRRSFYSLTYHNRDDALGQLQQGSMRFDSLLDRASDSDESFRPLIQEIRKRGTYQLNPPEKTRHANDKASMHLEFLTAGINVPFTIIISPFVAEKEVRLALSDLAHLGRPFIIKPANTTGGGAGVILGAETLKDVIDSRQHHKDDKYLLQEKILPGSIQNRKAWFRVFSLFGKAVPCWWDHESHIYQTLAPRELEVLDLEPLVSITEKIHSVCQLEFFSTEIACTDQRRFVVVDYVNDICDMRLQSKHPDGVPDEVVHAVARLLTEHCLDGASPHKA